MDLHRFSLYLFFIALSFSSTALAQTDNIWLLIDTKKLELDVKLGPVTLTQFKNISIGRNGAGYKKQRGDDTTPLGKYKISWINRKSRYHVFYGFNYPSREQAEKAFEKGQINQKTYQSVINSHKNSKVPPQNTPLGGMIGIHGLGHANKRVHELMNWTHGCIALTNEQIDQLDQWIKTDTIVVVR